MARGLGSSSRRTSRTGAGDIGICSTGPSAAAEILTLQMALACRTRDLLSPRVPNQQPETRNYLALNGLIHESIRDTFDPTP